MTRTILNEDFETLIDKQIKACIHCGMCLPACPTYKVTANEGNSPRGRLYLINDLVKGSEPSEQVVDYLDNCLSCYACETACPSGVQYADILEYARNDLGQSNYNKGKQGFMRKLAFAILLPNRWLLNLARIFYRAFGFMIPIKPKPDLNFEYKKIKTDKLYRSEEILFDISDDERTIVMPLGCVMDTLYNPVHWDTIYVLNRFGYHVYIPDSGCCGALAAHSGEEKISHNQLEATLIELMHLGYPVIMNSAGCGAFLKDHATDLQSDKKSSVEFIKMLDDYDKELKILDLIEALKEAPHDPVSESFFEERDNDVDLLELTYHPACHLNHRQGVAYDYLDILRKIPNLNIKELYDADTCCGSAGFYNLIKPEMANEIGKIKRDHIKNTGVHTVVTANPGCMSQIQSQLGENYDVVHPISVIANYLQTNAS